MKPFKLNSNFAHTRIYNKTNTILLNNFFLFFTTIENKQFYSETCLVSPGVNILWKVEVDMVH